MSVVDQVREHGGDELVERLHHLEATRGAAPPPEPPDTAPDAGATLDADVVIAGGGLSLLLAPVLADRGLRVVVLERGRAGVTHREWNASGAELTPLWQSGLFTRAEVEALVVARYRTGVCRWHRGGSYPIAGVLDHAVDAATLLRETRARAAARGVTILDRHHVTGERAGAGGIAIRARSAEGSVTLSARLLVDARGAASPYARADLVCPTVGGVLGELAVDPTVGDILATIDDARDGRQLVWEGFPGRAGETTVYAFYYARSADVRPGALIALYARFFADRPAYAAGAGTLLRPTFGYIPGWSRLAPAPRAPGPRVVLFGDAAARHSPLTYCGFGAMLRAFVPTADAIAALLTGRDDPRLQKPDLTLIPDDAIHAGTGALSALMSRPARSPYALNDLLNAAFATLAELGPEPYAALLQDRMSARDFVRFLERTARRHPAVYGAVLRALGPAAVARWAGGIAGAAVRARGASA